MTKQNVFSSAQEFLFTEATLLDQGEYERWYELFTEDAIYWMPLGYGQTEADQYNALFHEDKLLLKVRIERLRHPRAFSQSPASRSQHVLQPPRIEREEGRSLFTCTPFFYAESHSDEQFWLAGTLHHELIAPNEVSQGQELWQIRRKRIELLNREAALPSIELFL